MQPPDSPQGHEARLQNLERTVERNTARVNALETFLARQDQRILNLDEDLKELKAGIAEANSNCRAIREYVDHENKRRDEREAQENIEKRKLRTSEKLALWSVGGGLLAALIAAVTAIVVAAGGGGSP